MLVWNDPVPADLLAPDDRPLFLTVPTTSGGTLCVRVSSVPHLAEYLGLEDMDRVMMLLSRQACNLNLNPTMGTA